MKTGIATITRNVLCGAMPHEFSVIVTNNADGSTSNLGDIRRWAVSSIGQGYDIAERAGVHVISHSEVTA
jgi:hypothetical protein